MERNTFIKNCKNLRKGQRGFVVNTSQTTPRSLMTIDIYHESIDPFRLIVYNQTNDVTVLQSNYFRLRDADYQTAWTVLEEKLNRMVTHE